MRTEASYEALSGLNTITEDQGNMRVVDAEPPEYTTPTEKRTAVDDIERVSLQGNSLKNEKIPPDLPAPNNINFGKTTEVEFDEKLGLELLAAAKREPDPPSITRLVN